MYLLKIVSEKNGVKYTETYDAHSNQNIQAILKAYDILKEEIISIEAKKE